MRPDKKIKGRHNVQGNHICGCDGLYSCSFPLNHRYPKGSFPNHKPVISAIAYGRRLFSSQLSNVGGFGLSLVASRNNHNFDRKCRHLLL